mmetsp:Transcript_32945/g.49877  ORF Transcript_32945/g.49877 Transcript_32945/m.49877 type:complete len:123 (-) Transcript_32945:407-775(-)
MNVKVTVREIQLRQGVEMTGRAVRLNLPANGHCCQGQQQQQHQAVAGKRSERDREGKRETRSGKAYHKSVHNCTCGKQDKAKGKIIASGSLGLIEPLHRSMRDIPTTALFSQAEQEHPQLAL